jgi:hypothetical protein
MLPLFLSDALAREHQQELRNDAARQRLANQVCAPHRASRASAVRCWLRALTGASRHGLHSA